ncbi:MAG: hypothetical protein ABIJ53_07140, partial [Verrucomicrobiota bacterium]
MMRFYMRSFLSASLLGVLCCGILPGMVFAQEQTNAVPEWRGKSPGTAWLGPDVLWRPREWLVFHMLDETGEGFNLEVTVRDMNVYMQGPRPLMIWVVGPNDATIKRIIVEDDGIVSGNERYCDGIYDVFMDFRYREWHRVHSPEGYPPGKARSPYLDTPERLPCRTRKLKVSGGGRGLYRVFIVGSWDHWVSITPDRPIPTGVHPGPGTLYVHKDRFEEAYFYIPPAVKDIMVSVSEEIQPFNWNVTLEDETGNVLGKTTPRTFLSYILHTPEKGDSVCRLRVKGHTEGACLNIIGVPFVLTPDRETARKIAGGLQVDGKERQTFHHHQRIINKWIDTLTAKDVTIDIKTPDLDAIEDKELRDLMEKAPGLLASQNLEFGTPEFGSFPEKQPGIRFETLNNLAKLAGRKDADNPYY